MNKIRRCKHGNLHKIKLSGHLCLVIFYFHLTVSNYKYNEPICRKYINFEWSISLILMFSRGSGAKIMIFLNTTKNFLIIFLLFCHKNCEKYRITTYSYLRTHSKTAMFYRNIGIKFATLRKKMYLCAQD